MTKLFRCLKGKAERTAVELLIISLQDTVKINIKSYWLSEEDALVYSLMFSYMHTLNSSNDACLQDYRYSSCVWMMLLIISQVFPQQKKRWLYLGECSAELNSTYLVFFHKFKGIKLGKWYSFKATILCNWHQIIS